LVEALQVEEQSGLIPADETEGPGLVAQALALKLVVMLPPQPLQQVLELVRRWLAQQCSQWLKVQV
jgi:hypothetical protein